MNKQTIIIALLALVAMALVSCGSSEPEWVDPEAHEKTEQLQKQYGPLLIGTWHYEKVGEGTEQREPSSLLEWPSRDGTRLGQSQRFFEELTFKDDGTFMGMHKWQTRKIVTIDGEQRYTDWETLELSGAFTGTWSLSYWAPYGGEKHNYLQLIAKYDNVDLNYMAYSTCLTFGYAYETTLHIQGFYVHNDDGWADYQRGDAEPSF